MSNMKAYFTRDSVCAGDDGDAPHAAEIDLPNAVTIDALVTLVWQAAKLPSIMGGMATWCVSSGIPLAVIAQQWPTPKRVGLMSPKLADLDWAGQTVRLHFSYFTQQDPDAVLAVLSRLRLKAE